ncbi:MAG: efflux RND transporter periplasmic adaptor subunit, partial [Defluviitaleaceae bacterium]|nr:efflux RND transporter periplasmic adaptor subunit [Defluviitaleaceae bacterium]
AELGLAATRIAPTRTELLAAENQIEQSRSNVANIQAQLDQIDLQISQLQDNIVTAQGTQRDVQSLFDSGVASRVELDNANDAVRRLQDQLAITQSQRDAAALGLPLARESERLAVSQFQTVRDRNAQPAAVNQAQMQQVSVEQAQLRIAMIERNIAEFEREERAPISGTILSVMVTEGEFSATGRPMMEIADVSSSNLVVVVHVPENDAGNILVGQEVEISGGALGGHAYEGYIQLIHPIAAPRQIGNTVETVLTVEINPVATSRLRAGTTVDADIVTQVNEDTMVLPLMATLSEGGGVNYVFIVNDESILERRDITLGGFSDMYIEVFGVSEYDRVVSNPTTAMYDGMQARPLPPID